VPEELPDLQVRYANKAQRACETQFDTIANIPISSTCLSKQSYLLNPKPYATQIPSGWSPRLPRNPLYQSRTIPQHPLKQLPFNTQSALSFLLSILDFLLYLAGVEGPLSKGFLGGPGKWGWHGECVPEGLANGKLRELWKFHDFALIDCSS
jgi:hypothetical protein